MKNELKIRQAKPLEEVKKLLELCSKNTNCDKCSYRHSDFCFRELCKDVLFYMKINKIQDIRDKKSV